MPAPIQQIALRTAVTGARMAARTPAGAVLAHRFTPLQDRLLRVPAVQEALGLTPRQRLLARHPEAVRRVRRLV